MIVWRSILSGYRDVELLRLFPEQDYYSPSLSGGMSSTAAKSALVRSFLVYQLFIYYTFSQELFDFDTQHGTAYG